MRRGLMQSADPILDEFVQYTIYPDPKDVEAARQLYPNPGGDFMKLYLQGLRMAILEKCPPLLRNYVWFEDSFNLHVSSTHLSGKVMVGDGIEDEWFIAYLLLEVSKALPGLTMTLSDADGEFLLIEAADHLPEWLEPESSDFRVFIKGGKIHIVDIEDIAKPTMSKSLEFIQGNPGKSVAAPSIQNAIEEKIQRFRTGTQDLHHARCVVPGKIASALQKYPGLVSVFSKEFNERTASNMTKATFMKNSRIKDSSLKLASIRVAFTKTQFARLLCQQIHEAKGYPMPLEGSPDHLAYNMGLKLTVGAELACINSEEAKAKSKAKNNPNVTEQSVAEQMVKHFNLDPSTVYAPQIPDISEILSSQSIEEIQIYEGPDDDMNWLNIEEGDFMEELSRKMVHFKLTEKERETALFNRLLAKDYENPKVSARLQDFLSATSGYGGIEVGDSQDESDSSDESEYEDKEAFLDRELEEIMEAIAMDPDLTMKILEIYDQLEIPDKGEFVAYFQEFVKQKNMPEAIAELKSCVQKGIADIDPEKVAEARKGTTRPWNPENFGEDEYDTEDEDEYEDEDEGEEKVKSKDGKDKIKGRGKGKAKSKGKDQGKGKDVKSGKPANKPVSRKPPTLGDLMDSIDPHIQKYGTDSDIEEEISKFFRKSAKADKSPAHGMIASMK